MIDQHDALTCHCRMLGHEVPFSYCRKLQSGIPCSRIADCWFEYIGIEDFLKSQYSEDELKKIFSPPRPKMATIIDIVNRLNQNNS
ncbi:MAG TPA: hypothetical protein PKM65_03855 [Spirochaetota bacterium]|nr:hypothetical protein [Spirochaetota bacterium]HNT10781.1 hypothetical protein [Spirochaetota bacterium]HNV48778.1 hypothetical protein [Spirochaetota bacterium]HPU89147.1 hypothetical protein [Spirochaetota bacterium]